jgi:membrane protein involved in colicin uptake
MNKVVLSIVLTFLLVGCSDGTDYEETIQSLEEEVSTLTTDLDAANQEKENFTSENKKLSDDFTSLENEYNDYKERMAPYEDLEAAEAEARKLEADRLTQEEQEAKEEREEQERLEKEQAEKEAAEKEAAEQAAAEQAAQEEAAQGYETGITYDQLARTPDDYIGEKVKFSGKVVQVIEGDGETQLRFAVDDDYDQMIYLAYYPEIVEQRVLEDDYLTIYGSSLGTISYESTLGGMITIPAAFVDNMEFN